MSNLNYTQKMFTLHNYPVLLDCSFIVDSTAGFGQRSLRGRGISQIHMHSASPASGNLNPASGYAVIYLSANYKRYLGGFNGFVTPVTGSAISSGLTVGVPYVISALGASTLAQFQAAGLPIGSTPAVGMSFIAKATSIAGGATVKAAGASGIDSIEIVGDPSLSLTTSAAPTPRNAALAEGPYLIVKFMLDGVAAAPANESSCQMSFYLSNSSLSQA